MSLEEQVLVIAFFAVALKLLLWSKEEDVVGVDFEPDRKDVLHLDDSGCDSQREPGQTEGTVATALRPRLDRR